MYHDVAVLKHKTGLLNTSTNTAIVCCEDYTACRDHLHLIMVESVYLL